MTQPMKLLRNAAIASRDGKCHRCGVERATHVEFPPDMWLRDLQVTDLTPACDDCRNTAREAR